MLLQQSAFFKLRTNARHDRRQPLRRGRARSSKGVPPLAIVLLQQSAFFKLRMDARHDRRQPLRRCRATSPCRGGSSCRENWSAVVLRPCTTARQARRQPLRSSASPGVARASRPWSGVARPSRPWSGVARPSRPWSGVARPSRPWQLCYYNKARYSNYARTHVMTGANPSGAVVPPPLAGEALLVVKT